ncbi:SOS response-associated peptidase [Rarobacter incanus]|uniref:Abasic site processing protein n=1 Tax=Rarobacter incanus TaxID=153494 RepID=A0A542SN73_9MICO|nr:SOS response-associated peptidase [Rarobacter incanus]TQK76079.1 putative SOS response-associated peptidase YedK [Rarobacter incanus]
MCGRYADFKASDELAALFAVDPAWISESAAAHRPNWNVAPTRDVRVVVSGPADDPGAVSGSSSPAPMYVRRLNTARWGLVPAWSADLSIGARMINARAETVATKRSFKAAANKRRCIIPADAYYEWQRREGGKVPFAIAPAGAAVFAFAGLYEFWSPRGGGPAIATCTIITTAAAGDLARIHDRRPVMLAGGDYGRWLDPTRAFLDVEPLLHTPQPPVRSWRVSPLVGNVRNNGPELLRPDPPLARDH